MNFSIATPRRLMGVDPLRLAVDLRDGLRGRDQRPMVRGLFGVRPGATEVGASKLWLTLEKPICDRVA